MNIFIGILMGCLQFWICYHINQKVGGWTILFLALTAMIGYAAVDYGIYFSMTIPIKGIEGISDGNSKLSNIVPFSEYMKWRLGSSSISTRYGTELFEMGASGTTISHVIDFVGVLLGALGILLYYSENIPYCENCSNYKKRERKYEIIFDYDEVITRKIFSRILELMGKGSYKEFVAYFKELSDTFLQDVGDVKIFVDQRYCSSCREASILGKVYRIVGQDWKATEFNFLFTSKKGEHISLNV
jgi:hypothetical protein